MERHKEASPLLLWRTRAWECTCVWHPDTSQPSSEGPGKCSLPGVWKGSLSEEDRGHLSPLWSWCWRYSGSSLWTKPDLCPIPSGPASGLPWSKLPLHIFKREKTCPSMAPKGVSFIRWQVIASPEHLWEGGSLFFLLTHLPCSHSCDLSLPGLAFGPSRAKSYMTCESIVFLEPSWLLLRMADKCFCLSCLLIHPLFFSSWGQRELWSWQALSTGAS